VGLPTPGSLFLVDLTNQQTRFTYRPAEHGRVFDPQQHDKASGIKIPGGKKKKIFFPRQRGSKTLKWFVVPTCKTKGASLPPIVIDVMVVPNRPVSCKWGP